MSIGSGSLYKRAVTIKETSVNRKGHSPNLRPVQKTILMEKILIFSILLFLSSCLLDNQTSRRVQNLQSSQSNGGSTNNGGTTGNGSVGNGADSSSPNLSQKILLTHVVDPFVGSFKKKVTIPKNFKGNIYIGGINISSLSGKLLKARFKFGVNRQVFNFPSAVYVAKGSGIVPSTSSQLIVLDFSKRPFQDLYLPYDLYDYNDYNGDTSLEPVTDNRNDFLYCRGLKLADDPTFVQTSTQQSCSLGTDKCLYAYAKIADASFYSTSTGVSTSAIKPALWLPTTNFDSNLVVDQCLPDYNYANFLSLYSSIIPSGFEYKGAFRTINQSGWEISAQAYFGFEVDTSTAPSVTRYFGLFESGVYSGIETPSDRLTWSRSLLFPRSGTVKLNQGVNYIGTSTHPLRASTRSARTVLQVDSSYQSQYVDGCHVRALNYSDSSSESIGSCTVNGLLEIYSVDADGKETIHVSTSDIKIQVVRASETNSEGKETLSTAFKKCESSSKDCGPSECCFNKQCWSKDLVNISGQCSDEISGNGYRKEGDSCDSDFQCSSLCCKSGKCSPHNPGANPPIFCQKEPQASL